MTKSTFLAICLFLTVAAQVAAQTPQLILQNGNRVAVFTTFSAAVSAAQTGDTLYLPGGVFAPAAGDSINKLIHIIGAGYHPDSTKATYPTILSAALVISTNGSGGSIQGVQFNTTLQFGRGSGAPVSGYSVARCYIAGGNAISFSGGLGTGFFHNTIIFRENIILGYFSNAAGSRNLKISNNWIYNFNTSGPFNNSSISNNVFAGNLVSNSAFPFSAANSVFEYNVFNFSNNPSQIISPSSNCIFRNNIFVDNVGFPNGSNNGVDNLVGQSLTTVFVNPVNISSFFAAGNDFRLKTTCCGGTNLTATHGMYGGDSPFKATPSNPLIISGKVASAIQNGTLNLKATVVAQPR